MVYASEQVHMSIGKAVALLGLGRENLRLVPTDSEFRMRTDELEHAIARDRAAGLTPIAVVASAGTVATGAVLFRDRGAARRAFSHSGDYTRSFTEDPLEGYRTRDALNSARGARRRTRAGLPRDAPLAGDRFPPNPPWSCDENCGLPWVFRHQRVCN